MEQIELHHSQVELVGSPGGKRLQIIFQVGDPEDSFERCQGQ